MRRILFLEDEPTIREVLAEYMKMQRYEVTEACDGDEAVALLKSQNFDLAVKEMGCNKVAYAHHKDDIIETMLLSLIFEGRFYSFSPKTYLDRMDLTVIRPIMFVDEAEVIGFKQTYDLPVVTSRCPIDGYSKRQYAKELVKQLDDEHAGARQRMFTAILNGNIKGWPPRIPHVR